MKQYILFTPIFISIHYSFSQTKTLNSNEIENIIYFSKVWELLKYYHPEMESGKFNWDKEFMKINSGNKEEKSLFYENWLDGLGKVKKYKNIKFPNEELQLLDLVKDWNIIAYFYPYKYITYKNEMMFSKILSYNF